MWAMFLQNRGEEISLRLRTDDLRGFRKYDSIKKTLLHELVIPICFDIVDHTRTIKMQSLPQ